MLCLHILCLFKKKHKFVQKPHIHRLFLHMDNLAVQAIGIVCICVLVLLQIYSVFAVYHDDSHSVRAVKGQTKLCGNLLDILIIYLISKKQIV